MREDDGRPAAERVRIRAELVKESNRQASMGDTMGHGAEHHVVIALLLRSTRALSISDRDLGGGLHHGEPSGWQCFYCNKRECICVSRVTGFGSKDGAFHAATPSGPL